MYKKRRAETTRRSGALLMGSSFIFSSNAAGAAGPVSPPQPFQPGAQTGLPSHHTFQSNPAARPVGSQSGSHSSSSWGSVSRGLTQGLLNGNNGSTNASGLLHRLPSSTFSAAAASVTVAPGAAGKSLQVVNPLGQGLDLDLTSTATDIVLGKNIFAGAAAVTITVGGVQQTYSAGSKVTAAEYVAIKQALSPAGQSIVLDKGGSADGGSFTLNGLITAHVSGLVVPSGVTGIDYFSSNKVLSVGGDILDYGSIYGVSTNSHIVSGTIGADNITVESGGLLSTQLPSALSATIANGVAGTSLALTAHNDITNAGTISSAGNLSLATTTGVLNNTSAIHSAQNINISVGSGNIVNSGLIDSHLGNINIGTGQQAADLNIDGRGGTFTASGDINVRNANYNGANNINMAGGNYLSTNLNLNGGTGAITGSVGHVTGILNTQGNAAHFIASTPTLVLGKNAIDGDPTYANTTGDIVIDGAVTASESIAILAAGNITVGASSNASISTANSVGGASIPMTDITLVAGATVTTTGSPIIGTLPGGNDIGTGNTATVNFSAGNGGNIDLKTNNTPSGTVIDTSSNLPLSGLNQNNGGNVILAAYAGTTSGGHVVLPAGGDASGTSINTSSVNGSGGAVTIIAGANQANAVNIGGRIITSGGGSLNGGSSGTVSIYIQRSPIRRTALPTR